MSITLNGTTGITSSGDITLNNGNADGAQVTLTSSGYSNWNIDNYSGRFRAYYNATEYFTIDTSGNVGIGTSGPNAKLDVVGQILTGSTGNNAVAINSSGSNYGFISNPSNGVFALGYGATIGTLGTSVATWNSSGNFGFNSGYGSVATAYGCRAWVKFNGTGTPAINGSGNVTSITDNGTGDYTINFTTALADTNYSVVLGNNYNGTGAFAVINPNTAIYSTTQVKIQVVDRNGSAQDTSILNAAILR